MLGPDGTWEGLPYQDGTYIQKVFWWRSGNHGESQPQFTVTGERIDGSAPALVTSKANYGASNDIGSFIVVGVGIPVAGCWRITGHDAGADLTFVVWIAAD